MTLRSSFPPGLDLLVAWERAFEQLLAAARDTAEFDTPRPIGRSRSASIRKLAAAVRHVDDLASSNAATFNSVRDH